MTTVAAIKLLTFLESAFLALLANREARGSKINATFVRYILFVAAGSLVELMLVTSPTEGVFRFWKHFDVFMYFAVAAFLQFSLMLRGCPWASSVRFNLLLYGGTSLIAFFEGVLIAPIRVVPGIWSYRSAYARLYLDVHAALVLAGSIAALATLAVLWRCVVEAKDRRARAQAEIFFWSTLVVVATGVSLELVPAFVPSIQLPLSVTATTAYLVVNPVLVLAVVRYGLLQLSPVSAVGAIMDLMSESVIITDRQGRLHYLNKAALALTGRRKADAQVSSIDGLALRDSPTCPSLLSYQDLYNRGAGLRDHECLLEGADGNLIPVAVSTTMLGTRPGDETGLILTLRDISERRRIEELRDGADRVMRHDLRNTLTGLATLSGSLAADRSLDEEQRETVTMIHEGARLLHEQIDSYLYLRAVEDGSFKAPLEVVDLAAVLRGVQRTLQGLADSMNVHVAFLVDGRPTDATSVIHVRAIRAMLFGIFVNLIKNAIEASPFGSEVRVSVRTTDAVVVAVHNRGAIPEEIRPRFLTKFATAGKRRGTGIGAYGARMLAEALGCLVSFTTSEEQGTELLVSFPSLAADG